MSDRTPEDVVDDILAAKARYEQAALTGQVKADPAWPVCPQHRETMHCYTKGCERHRWCNRCGWNRVLAKKVGTANGGWGTP